jgi:hypothetical protein
MKGVFDEREGKKKRNDEEEYDYFAVFLGRFHMGKRVLQ